MRQAADGGQYHRSTGSEQEGRTAQTTADDEDEVGGLLDPPLLGLPPGLRGDMEGRGGLDAALLQVGCGLLWTAAKTLEMKCCAMQMSMASPDFG